MTNLDASHMDLIICEWQKLINKIEEEKPRQNQTHSTLGHHIHL